MNRELRRRRTRGGRAAATARGAVGAAALALVVGACEPPPPPPPSHLEMTLRVERGDLLMLADGRGRLDSARPYVDADSILPECQPVVVQDDLVLRFEDSASVEHPEDPLSRRTGWWLDGGSVVIEVVNQPDCLDERFHAVVIDSSYTEDGIEEPAATLVVTIDSPVWGVLNRAVLVK